MVISSNRPVYWMRIKWATARPAHHIAPYTYVVPSKYQYRTQESPLCSATPARRRLEKDLTFWSLLVQAHIYTEIRVALQCSHHHGQGATNMQRPRDKTEGAPPHWQWRTPGWHTEWQQNPLNPQMGVYSLGIKFVLKPMTLGKTYLSVLSGTAVIG